MEEICQRYWLPVYAFLRQRGASPADAEDLTQSFFAKLIKSDNLRSVREGEGKLRSYLLAAVQNENVDQWRKDHAQRRGGDVSVISFEQDVAEERYHEFASTDDTPDEVFDRGWFTSVVEEAKRQLRQSLKNRGREEAFEVMEQYLLVDARGEEAEATAQKLGITTGSLRVTLHRFREKFRSIVRERLGETVADESELSAEMAYFCQLGFDSDIFPDANAV